MNNDIQKLLNDLIKNDKISKEQLFDFGKNSAQHIIGRPDEELKDDFKEVYNALLRKGHIAMDCFDSTYDTYFRHHVIEGIEKGLLDQSLPKEDVYSYRSKMYEYMPQHATNYNGIIQVVAVNFADEAIEENLPKLAKELFRRTGWHWQQGETQQDLAKFWNKVYDEFELRNRLDLIPKLADNLFSDFTNSINKKVILQGLSNLGHENPDNLDFDKISKDFYQNEKKDEINILVKNYFESPTDIALKQLGKDLAKTITKHPIEDQTGLWNKAREDFEKHSVDDKFMKFGMLITTGAIEEINSSEEREALITGLSGYSKYFKPSKDKITGIRDKYNPTNLDSAKPKKD